MLKVDGQPECYFQSNEETIRMTIGTFSCAAMAVLLLGATGSTMAAAEKERKTATAAITDAKGQSVGQAKFTATKGGVQMSVTVANLSPGVHAIHIHDAGKCEAPGFTTAGPHFNPANKKHGMQNPEGHHAGDLPNLTVGANGKGTFKSTIQDVTLAGDGATSLFHAGGTSVVIHQDADDMKTDPAGNAGVRMACGVIQ
jgi:superoxide dismutase, Cu-Zn family